MMEENGENLTPFTLFFLSDSSCSVEDIIQEEMEISVTLEFNFGYVSAHHFVDLFYRYIKLHYADSKMQFYIDQNIWLSKLLSVQKYHPLVISCSFHKWYESKTNQIVPIPFLDYIDIGCLYDCLEEFNKIQL